MARRPALDELGSGMLFDRAHERVAFDIAHGWGKLHYEQLAKVQGTVTVGGQQIPFDGTGLRDHTRGQLRGHVPLRVGR